MIVALAGGVGGAKLAQGLSRALSAQELAIVVNTGDDFEHLGLSVSPDIDTVVYTLAGLANPVTGWGLAGESWSFMAALGRLGGETWFRLGDGDLATHVERTRLLAQGTPLSEITRRFGEALGVGATILPASDDRVRTFVSTEEGELAFQRYFVGRQCEPRLLGLTYRHAEAARPAPAAGSALDGASDFRSRALPVQSLPQHRADPCDSGRARLDGAAHVSRRRRLAHFGRARAEGSGGQDHEGAWPRAVRARRGALLRRSRRCVRDRPQRRRAGRFHPARSAWNRS